MRVNVALADGEPGAGARRPAVRRLTDGKNQPRGLSFVRAVNRRHWAASKRSITPSGSLESRTARPPPGSTATSTQFPAEPEWADFFHASLPVIDLTPNLVQQVDGLSG